MMFFFGGGGKLSSFVVVVVALIPDKFTIQTRGSEQPGIARLKSMQPHVNSGPVAWNPRRCQIQSVGPKPDVHGKAGIKS